MDKLAAKIYLTGKILELGKTLIYKTEILAKGKAGAEKFNQVYEGFWNKLEELLEKEKSIDRKWIPNFAEEVEYYETENSFQSSRGAMECLESCRRHHHRHRYGHNLPHLVLS